MLQSFLHWFGYGLCHQLSERSFFGGGLQLPVCARDTGVYIGVVASLALISALHGRRRPNEFPVPMIWLAMLAMVGAMVLDGATEYAGLRTTTNNVRLITGLMTGFALGAILLPMINAAVWHESASERVLSPGWRFTVWLAAVPVTFALVRWGGPLLGVGYPLLTVLVILLALGSVNLVILGILPPFEQHAERLRDLWLVAVLALALAMAEVWFSGLLRHFITSAVLFLIR